MIGTQPDIKTLDAASLHPPPSPPQLQLHGEEDSVRTHARISSGPDMWGRGTLPCVVYLRLYISYFGRIDVQLTSRPAQS